MDHCDGSSDSGVSVTERSVSRSSVLSDDRSSSAEVKPNTPTPTSATVPNKTSQASSSSSSSSSTAAAPLVLDRKEPIRVWRDPSLVSQSEHTVRHIHSVQHTAMSQHYPGVPPQHHAPPPSGGSAAPHAPPHHSSHGQPPVSLAHSLPPGLPYPAHPTAATASLPQPLHLPPGLQQPLAAAAAAGLYPLSHDMWKQLGPVPTIPHAYAGLLNHHQEEFLQGERARRWSEPRSQRNPE
ncbi:putative protein TPRXL [Penaeus monodon]|uniref:putative protein TPRXL n=1 Tax=Penaeus monodon TaxID=6687 RepID=UPI0018A79B0A|nr:putative protein TPRXL [Penaeus monodon]